MSNIPCLSLCFGLAGLAMAEPPPPEQKFSLPAGDWFQNFEFRAPAASRPSDVGRVVVILSRDLGALDGRLSEPRWQRFAEDDRAGIVAVAFTPQTRPPAGSRPGAKAFPAVDPRRTTEEFYGQLRRQLTKFYPRARSYGYFATDGAAGMMLSLLTSHPQDTFFWALEDVDWVVPADVKNLPPGLVINRDGGKTGKMLEAHLKNRMDKRPITFVRDTSADGAAADRFTHLLAHAAGSNSFPRPAVVDLETEVGLNPNTPRDKQGHTTWLPNEELVRPWQATHSLEAKERLSEVVVEQVDTGVPSQPTLNLYAKIPKGLKAGEPVKGAVCIATWMASDDAMHETLRGANVAKELVSWADANRMAVITWNTATVWKTGVGQEELERNVARGFDHNFDALASAWEKGIDRLSVKHAIPRGGFLFYGISRGAHWGHRLVLRAPQRFYAVHFHVANSYDVPNAQAKNVMWLITTGDLDAGYRASIDFYHRCRLLGYPIFMKVGAGLDHGDRQDIARLGNAFFDYAVSLSNASTPGQRKGQSPSDMMRRDLSHPSFVGDIINQDVYAPAESSWLPAAQRVPLVSRAIAEAWASE